MFRIKDRLKGLGKTQVWLIFKLRARGIEVQPPLLSNVINGVYTYPMAQRILTLCDEILTEYEKEDKVDVGS